MACGYNGKILRVNLSRRSLLVETPGDDFYHHYFGGRGLALHYLLTERAAGVDPLGPDNLLVFATGVLTGGPFGGSGRNSVAARSPLTGGFGEAEVGGFWGAQLKRACVDAILVEGRADTPVYLWLHDGQAEIRDASSLWGLTTAEAQEAIGTELGDRHIRTALIGPGGENRVRYACIMNDLRHAAGRTGMGAVMGSKNLKGIAARGHSSPPLADAQAVQAIGQWLRDTFQSNPGMNGLHLSGTAANVKGLNTLGALPTHNFREGVFEGADAISATALTETLLTERGTCFACPIRCKRVVRPQEPYGFDDRYGGPEYETIAAFGSSCGVANLPAIAKANALCSAYSLDTISTGMTIAFAMECFERGLLTAHDTGGLPLRFGDVEAMLQAIELIARRQGIGDLLAEGSYRAAARIGPEAAALAMHVKGQELPLQEPRLAHLRGLGYAINPAGADHLAGAVDTFFEKEGAYLANYRRLGAFQPIGLRGYDAGKVRLYAYSHIWCSFANCALLCLFVQYTFPQVLQLVEGVTGWNSSVWDLMKAGERAATLARAFNVREGFTPDDDRLPARFHTALAEGPLKGVAIDEEQLRQAKRCFYGIMGWDPNTGIPTPGKLDELGIGWVWGLLKDRDRAVRAKAEGAGNA
jgi:aldehyde:ferredoxin oxidoreductase